MPVDMMEQEKTEITNRHDGAVDDEALLREIGVSEGTAGFDNELKPSGGETQTDGLWTAGVVEADPVQPAQSVAEAPVTAPEPEIKPIATGLTESSAPMGDSMFTESKPALEPVDANLKKAKAYGDVPEDDPDSPELMFSKTMDGQRQTRESLIHQVPAVETVQNERTDQMVRDADRKIGYLEKAKEPAPETPLEKRKKAVELLGSQLVDIESGTETLVRKRAEIESEFAQRIAEQDKKKAEALAAAETAESEKITIQNERDSKLGVIDGNIAQSQQTEEALRATIKNLESLPE